MKIIFTPLAERHIAKLYDYIAKRSGEQRADDFTGRIIDHCRSLSTFPRRGTQRDDLLPGLRTIGFERSVTIAFVVTETAVLIEGIYYGGQDYEAIYRQEN